VSLKQLLKLNLKTVRAYLLKEDLRRLWQHCGITLAGAFLFEWCSAAKGFRSYDVTTNALYHGMGQLPEPVFRHRFC